MREAPAPPRGQSSWRGGSTARAPQGPEIPPAVVPAITDRRALRAEYERFHALYRLRTRRGDGVLARFAALAGWGFARFMALWPVRVVTHYMFHGGPLMSAGLAYQLLFASTSLLVIGFSVLGMVLGSSSALQHTLVTQVHAAIPGLLDVGDGAGGVLPVSLLENSAPFTLASGVAAGVLLFTSWRWVAGMRLAIRRIFELPPARGMPIAAVPRDIAWLVVIGLLLLASAAASIVASGAVAAVTQWLHELEWIPRLDWPRGDLNAVLTFVLGLGVDLLMVWALVRGVSQLKLHRKAFVVTLAVGALGSQLLRYGGSELIARSTNNPYLFSFAVLVGVLLWFNLFGQVLLLASAAGAVVQADIRGARAQPEREPRAVTVVATSSLPLATRGTAPVPSSPDAHGSHAPQQPASAADAPAGPGASDGSGSRGGTTTGG